MKFKIRNRLLGIRAIFLLLDTLVLEKWYHKIDWLSIRSVEPVAPYDFGHQALCETDFPREKTDENDRILGQATVEAIMQCVNEQAAGFLITGAAHRVEPAFANYHLILARIKKALDPKNKSHPCTGLYDTT